MNDNTLLALYKQCAALGTNLWLGKDDTFFGTNTEVLSPLFS
jgi:hypothetical protein